jgi:cholesterol oxidase
VHDNPGLFIADASALPAAPGVPPSMTIAAWAGHLAMSLVSVKGEKKHVAFR